MGRPPQVLECLRARLGSVVSVAIAKKGLKPIICCSWPPCRIFLTETVAVMLLLEGSSSWNRTISSLESHPTQSTRRVNFSLCSPPENHCCTASLTSMPFQPCAASCLKEVRWYIWSVLFPTRNTYSVRSLRPLFFLGKEGTYRSWIHSFAAVTRSLLLKCSWEG